jgi:hypothetical protein
MRMILQFCLLLLMLLGAETRAWGKVDVGQNIASGGLPLFLVDCTDGDAPPALITQGEPGPWDYEPAPDVCNGPNLYAYVKQNPWTSFDPDGLKGEYAHATMTAIKDGMEFVADVVCAVGKGIGGFFAGTNRRSQIQYQLTINPQASERQIQESANRQIEVNQSLEALAAVPHKAGRIPPSEPPVATGKATLTKAQAQVNRENGDAWENKIFDARQSMNGNAVRQLTIKSNESGKKTKIDVASRDPQTGAPILDEGKASVTAPLTKNQTQVFPELERSGGVVVGRGKPGFEGGTIIPPTRVTIVRPPQEEKKAGGETK